MFRALLTKPEFTLGLHALAAYAEEQHGVAGLSVQRHGKNNFPHIGTAQYPAPKTTDAAGLHPLIQEGFNGNIGVFVTGRAPVIGEKIDTTLLPTPEDLAEFQALLADNPHVIRGVITPLTLGGLRSFFWREHEPGVLDTSRLAQDYRDTSRDLAQAALSDIGLDSEYFEFPGGKGDTYRLFGEPPLPPELMGM